jgi:periplasmic divalent cation tolerance protein
MAHEKICVVLVTAPQGALAHKIARGLVQKRLAACVSVIPDLISHYSWKGSLHEDQELLLVIKTKTALFGKLAEFVRKHHSYCVPEIIALPILKGDKPYLDWLTQTAR